MTDSTTNNKAQSLTPFEKMEEFFDGSLFEKLFHKRMAEQYGNTESDDPRVVVVTKYQRRRQVKAHSKRLSALGVSVHGRDPVVSKGGSFVLKRNKKNSNSSLEKQNLSKS